MRKRFWKLAAVGVVAVGAIAPATVAYAADYPDGGNPPTVVDNTPEVEVAGQTQVRGQMPFTGGDIAALAAIGGGAIAIGGALVVQTRRRRTAEAS